MSCLKLIFGASTLHLKNKLSSAIIINSYKAKYIKSYSMMFSKTPKTIGTHNGSFHCDEVLGCWMLKQIDPYKEAKIIRTRELSLLKDLDIIIDVGGIYDFS